MATPAARCQISVDRCTATGGLQVSLGEVDPDGYGDGFRLAGPKYIGRSENVLTADLDQRARGEIRAYLDAADRRGDP